VLYAIRTLEDTLEFAVLDRSGYRTRLTARGRRVLEGCRALLAAEAELTQAIVELRAGWSPRCAWCSTGSSRSIRCCVRSAAWSPSTSRPGSTCAPSSSPVWKPRSTSMRRT